MKINIKQFFIWEFSIVFSCFFFLFFGAIIFFHNKARGGSKVESHRCQEKLESNEASKVFKISTTNSSPVTLFMTQLYFPKSFVAFNKKEACLLQQNLNCKRPKGESQTDCCLDCWNLHPSERERHRSSALCITIVLQIYQTPIESKPPNSTKITRRMHF